MEKFPSHITSDIEKKVKIAAIKLLGEIKERVAVESLIKTLATSNIMIKNAALEALGTIGDERSIDPIIESLKDETAKVSAAKALGEIGNSKPVQDLINLLKDKDSDVRSAAAVSLGQIKDPLALSALIIALEEDRDVNVRRLASIAIGEIGNEEAVPVLIKKLDDQFMNVAVSSADALIKIGLPSIKPLIEVIENKLAADALIKIGEPAEDELIKILTHENENIRGIAAKCLGKMKIPGSVKYLVRELKNNSEKTLKIMRDSIFFICSSSLLPLSEELNKADEITQDLVVEIFFDIGNLTDNGVERLKNELNVKNPVFQKLIIRALGRLHDEDMDLFKDLFLSTECIEVKKEILKTINQINPREDMLEFLQRAMGEKNPEIRELALQAIINIGSPSTCSILIDSLSGGEENLKHISAKGLGMINHSEAITALLKTLQTGEESLKLTIIEALSNKIDEEVISALTNLLNNSSSTIQIAVIKALTRIGDKKAIPHIKLLKKNSSEEVKKETEIALQAMEGPKSFWAKLFGS